MSEQLNRRNFIQRTALGAGSLALLPKVSAVEQLTAGALSKTEGTVSLTISSPALQLQLEADTKSARLTKLGWDTEGTGRAGINLLKSPVELRLSKQGQVLTPQVRFEALGVRMIRYNFGLADGKQLTWEIAAHPDGLRMQVSCREDISVEVDKVELIFPFEPKTALTSVISSNWTDDGRFQIPAIISAPDLGQMLVKCAGQSKVTGRTEGNRGKKWLTTTFELAIPRPGSAINLE